MAKSHRGASGLSPGRPRGVGAASPSHFRIRLQGSCGRPGTFQNEMQPARGVEAFLSLGRAVLKEQADNCWSPKECWGAGGGKGSAALAPAKG